MVDLVEYSYSYSCWDSSYYLVLAFPSSAGIDSVVGAVDIKNRCHILIFVFISSFTAKFLFLPDPVAEVNAEGYYSD